jgi:hypothetical protein
VESGQLVERVHIAEAGRQLGHRELLNPQRRPPGEHRSVAGRELRVNRRATAGSHEQKEMLRLRAVVRKGAVVLRAQGGGKTAHECAIE